MGGERGKEEVALHLLEYGSVVYVDIIPRTVREIAIMFYLPARGLPCFCSCCFFLDTRCHVER